MQFIYQNFCRKYIILLNLVNPLLPSVPRSDKILILIEEGTINKISCSQVGRQKEPILGYVPKNNVKKNSRSKGLIYKKKKKLHKIGRISLPQYPVPLHLHSHQIPQHIPHFPLPPPLPHRPMVPLPPLGHPSPSQCPPNQSLPGHSHPAKMEAWV